jgi:tRNA nucleotidyltransferase/poly(A) polymerase
VARIKGQVIGHGGTPEQAQQAAKAARPKEKAEIIFVPFENPLQLPPLLQRLRGLLPDGQPLYLVGGAVRDLLLGRQINDFDFMLPTGAIPFARRLADRLEAAFYPLDEEHDVGRILLTEAGQRVTLDFIRQRGSDLEADLRARDFTINAIALDLRQPEALLDPLGGAADLLARRLRACAPTAFSEDPLRIWRGIRMAASFQLKIELETRAWMKAASPLLPGVSAERLRDELFQLLLAPKPATSLRALDMLGALEPVLPELAALKGVEQPSPHIYEVWEHTLHVLASLEKCLGILDENYPPEGARDLQTSLIVLDLGRYRQQISQHLKREEVEGRPLRALLFLAALYHDAAKPLTRGEKNGRISFTGHADRGADLVYQRAEDLRLSKAERTRLERIVRHHMRPAQFTRHDETPSRRAIYRFFRDTGDAGVEVCLLSLADQLGRSGAALPESFLRGHLASLRSFLEAYYERAAEIVAPPPLLSGEDLIRTLGLKPGPKIGGLLAALGEAQAAGEVSTREQALEFVKMNSQQ